MNKDELRDRTKKLGLRVIRLTAYLPKNQLAHIISDQILRCSLSVGANYRAVCRAKSGKDFINKMKIVEEEADEVVYWLEIIEETGLIKEDLLKDLKQEANEIVSIIVASIKTKSQSLNSKWNHKS